MKELIEELKSGDLRQVYILTGEETYLRLQYRDRIADALCAPGDTMNRTSFYGPKTDPEEVIGTAETMPFFAERRVIILEDTLFCKNACPRLAEYVGRLPSHAYLILNEEEVDKRNALYKACVKAGRAVVFPRQDEATLAKWVAKLLGNAGRRIRMQDAEYFLGLTGSDMFRIRMETEKLISYTEGRDTVGRSDIDAVTSVEIENRIFDMIRATAEGRRERAAALYGDLLLLRESPLRILALLARQYDQLLRTNRLMGEKMGADGIAKLVGAPPFAVRNYMKLVRGSTEEEIRTRLALCVQTEEDIKSGRIDERLGVELVLLS